MLHTQIGKGATLIDTEQQLIGIYGNALMLQAGHFILAALQPAGRAFTAGFGVIVLGGVFHAFIKGHGDGRAKVCLDLHTFLRSHENLPAVNMRVESDTFLFDLPKTCQ